VTLVIVGSIIALVVGTLAWRKHLHMKHRAAVALVEPFPNDGESVGLTSATADSEIDRKAEEAFSATIRT